MTNNTGPSLSPDLKARILANAKATPSPTREITRRWQIGMLVGALLVATLPYAIYDFLINPGFIVPWITSKDILAGNTRQIPLSLMAWCTAGSFLVSIFVVWIALSRGRSMLGRSSRVLAIVIVATPVVLFCWRYGWSHAYGWDFQWYGSRSKWGQKCFLTSLATALAPLGAFLTLRRGSDPTHPGATGAAMGVSAGACSWMLVDLTCPVGAPYHLLIGHFLPIVILGAVGAIFGKWLLAVRAPR